MRRILGHIGFKKHLYATLCIHEIKWYTYDEFPVVLNIDFYKVRYGLNYFNLGLTC